MVWYVAQLKRMVRTSFSALISHPKAALYLSSSTTCTFMLKPSEKALTEQHGDVHRIDEKGTRNFEKKNIATVTEGSLK